ncbi:MAG: chorismate lyase [Candidatus Thioglobus sp.]|jgi:chorismate-pyruvate lyase|nr:hypothetical protein [Gammaproteobacteria bacterium]MDP6163079.1 chorismate lyase [Candidatus Thioglobus sp.]HJL79804.1 chorismate lyase [Gammaproteobacteria bacterium]HJM09606.1 chorismate lyase [Gammaproteobacteria bacterium]HJN01259.1 chorismate lyase [Gammaproteobacteria bacterium]|tara:strand:- start:15476 stop:15991 length:516 start_codon:yes stop_codon:yes gene_type:complete
MKSFSDIEAASNNLKWFENIKDAANPEDPICQNWLSHSGWMTDKLRKDFPEHILRVTSESMGEAPLMLRDLKINASGLTREIEISVLNDVSIFAQTFASNSTLEKNPWIKELGNSPLGGKLSLIEGIKRTGLSFASVEVGEDNILCRRSAFEINSDFIHLIEAFPSNLNEL